MDMFQQFHDVCVDPNDYARQWKAATGGKVVGTLCSYAPEELILAGRALGFRIVGGSGAISKADAHLQSYSCSLVRSALDDALSGRLDFLDGMIFPHTCDSIQRLSDIWRMNAGTGFHLDVVLPVKLNTESAREYMIAVMGKARVELEKALKREISDDDLQQAIQTCNGIRAAMQKLYQIRRENPHLVAGRHMHAITRASLVMDRHGFLKALTGAIEHLEKQPAPGAASGKRILICGGVCNLPDIYGLIESCGGSVVWDDLCTGSRQLTGPIAVQADRIAAIADRYLARAICPAKHAGIASRGDELIQMAVKSKCQAVIFVFLKFCDPHAFDYPYLKEMLAAQGIPSLLLELEEQIAMNGQLRTRCEAFLEML
jgi:bzd-type benzoyl-CoA reductase N subunit